MSLTKDEVIDALRKNAEIKKAVVAEIVSDAGFVSELARAIFSLKAEDVGIIAPGSISEFFHRRFTQKRRI